MPPAVRGAGSRRGGRRCWLRRRAAKPGPARRAGRHQPISRERQIYGVLVYGADGRARFAADPLQAGTTAPPGRVLATGRVTEFERHVEDEHMYSVLHPIPGPSGRIVAAFGSIDSAIERMKVGAYDYLTRPFGTEREYILEVP